MPMRISTVTFN